jgi:hypothetical protein
MSNRTKRSKLKPQRYCIFCLSSGRSNEHFWSEWIGDLIAIAHPQGAFEDKWAHSAHLPFPTLESRRFREGTTLSKKIKCVCEDCNNVWMSIIEEVCKDVMTPLILGRATALDEEDQLLIAIWVTLKIFIAEAAAERNVISTQKERTAFMKERALPIGLHIFIGQCGSGGWEASFWRTADTIGFPGKEPRPAGPNIQCVTIGAGELLIFAFQNKSPVPFDLNPGDFFFRIYPSGTTARELGPAQAPCAGGCHETRQHPGTPDVHAWCYQGSLGFRARQSQRHRRRGAITTAFRGCGVNDIIAKYFFIPPTKFRETYAADVPAADAQFLADSQQQLAEKALGAPVSAAAWRTKPSFAILTTQDHVISPELQRWMYQRSGSKVTEVGASHAVFVSQPDAVAGVIEAAAKVGE